MNEILSWLLIVLLFALFIQSCINIYKLWNINRENNKKRDTFK